jgi:hypothetical protein
MPAASNLRGQIRTAFQAGGEAAALEAGKALNLPEKKVRRWLRKLAAPAEPTKISNVRGATLAYSPKTVVTIIKRGAEVSEVKFKDGRTQYLSNEQLVETGA